MTVSAKAFKESASAGAAFDTEESILQNLPDFEEDTRTLLAQKPLSQRAYAFLFEIFGEKKRKDGKQPSRIHEQRHIHVGNRLLDYNNFITLAVEKKWGGKDVFFAALLLHDMKETKITEEQLQGALEADTLPLEDTRKDIEQTLHIVECMTREDLKDKSPETRSGHMRKLLGHVYAFIGKQIDWCDKLATMIGVHHFEKNNLGAMIAVVEETGLYFLDKNQAYARQAEAAFPFARKTIKAMDKLMGLQYNIFLHYIHSFPANQEMEGYDQLQAFIEKHKPEPFAQFYPEAARVLRGLHRGVHYIHNTLDRMEEAAESNPLLRKALDQDILPQLLPFAEERAPLASRLMNTFRARAQGFLRTVGMGPKSEDFTI